jgi:hypothetical protein
MNEKYYWLPPASGFLISGVNEIPDGALEITADRWNELLAGQSDGMQIVSGSDGYPVLEAAPEPTPLTPIQKLENLGLTTSDLKSLLGL